MSYSHMVPSVATEMESLQNNIRDLRRTQHGLFEQVDELEASIRYHEAHYGKLYNRKAPVSHIPDEILAMIFRCGQRSSPQLFNSSPSVAYSESHTGTSRSTAPTTNKPFEVIISHVTSHWRRVALDMSPLWTSINAILDEDPAMVLTYLERSKLCPIAIRLEVSGAPWIAGACGWTNPTIEALVSHASRWQCMSVIWECDGADDPILTLFGALSAPILEHLSLTVNETTQTLDDTSFIPQIFTDGTPKLSFLRLAGLSMYYFRPPLTTLTTLHLDQTKSKLMTFSRFHEILIASPSLTNLSVYGDMIASDNWSAAAKPMINMASLCSLRICGKGGFIYGGILLGIIAPGLGSLVLKDVLDPDMDVFWTNPKVSSLMTRFPILRSLTLCNCEFNETTYRHIFRNFPAIDKFSLLDSESSLGTLIALKLLTGVNADVILPPGPLPWQNLTSLTVILSFTDGTILADVVDARVAAGHPLRHLKLGIMLDNIPVMNSGIVEQVPCLRNRVEVEITKTAESWPSGLAYVDEDDLLFH